MMGLASRNECVEPKLWGSVLLWQVGCCASARALYVVLEPVGIGTQQCAEHILVRSCVLSHHTVSYIMMCCTACNVQFMLSLYCLRHPALLVLHVLHVLMSFLYCMYHRMSSHCQTWAPTLPTQPLFPLCSGQVGTDLFTVHSS